MALPSRRDSVAGGSELESLAANTSGTSDNEPDHPLARHSEFIMGRAGPGIDPPTDPDHRRNLLYHDALDRILRAAATSGRLSGVGPWISGRGWRLSSPITLSAGGVGSTA